MDGSTIYVDLFPCNECAKTIIQAGIKEVVYMSDEDIHKDSYKIARMMLNDTDVKIRKIEKTDFIKKLMEV
jgi:dCMP deaminase